MPAEYARSGDEHQQAVLQVAVGLGARPDRMYV